MIHQKLSVLLNKTTSYQSFITLCRNLSTVNIKVRQGIVAGKETILDNRRPCYAFKGIPYAQPPIGNLRFKPPLPLDKFETEVLDCSQERDTCLHRDFLSRSVIGSEDCLFLNVYSPNLQSSSKLPVMVWIHGGGFTMDSGSERLYSPDFLVEKDVIVVTFNYRIGALGFLSHPKAGISGNAGLKDQLMALKWVKENIENFGGDPNNVTLFGQSAGGCSTLLHSVNPESRKYFHKVICQSGSLLNDWTMDTSNEEKTRKLAEMLSKTEKLNVKEVYKSIMTAKASDIQSCQSKVLTLADRRLILLMPFRPVVEEESDNAIVSRDPIEAFKDLENNEIPIMLGYTSDEGMFLRLELLKRAEEFLNDPGRMMSRSVQINEKSPDFYMVIQDIQDFYLNGEKFSMDFLEKMTMILGDALLMAGLTFMAEMYAKSRSRAPFFFYRFSYDGDLNLQKKMLKLNSQGATHGDDMHYLFRPKALAKIYPGKSSPALQIRDKMVEMWTDFAKFGNPTPSHKSGLKWEPLKKIDPDAKEIILNALDINEEMKMIQGPDKERMAFWRNLHRKYNPGYLKV